MNRIHALQAGPEGLLLEPVWHGGPGQLAAGCTALTTVRVGAVTALYAFNKVTRRTAVYTLGSAAPWLQAADAKADLSGQAWDHLSSFVLGNLPYLMAYERESGSFAFHAVNADLTLSRPYRFALVRNTPTQGFTTVAAYTSLGQVFFTGYDFDTGVVANFSLGVTATASGGVPPLLALNVWHHQWARAWTQFAFFQLGGANFFFKINTGKLNVNIDHMHDNPAQGSVEVGSDLQDQLPDALKITSTAVVPWADGEPRLLTYIAPTGQAAVYRIHADCQGWSPLLNATVEPGASATLPYRIGDRSYVLFYNGA